MHRIVVAASAALLAACGSQNPGDEEAAQGTGAATAAASPTAAAPVAAEPDLATCPARELLEEGLRERAEPIPVPAALRQVMRSGMDNFAFATRDGATLCVDASWMEAIQQPALSADGRFASFDWVGYEAYGHVIVDLAGKGQVLDTGVPPLASPSGKLLAAADLGEAGFGALNAFAVWRIEPAGIRQLARHEDIPSATDWRIESWSGEACLDLSAIPWEGYTGDADTPRERFRARESSRWRLEPGRCAEG
jgi:hypothetical protein